MVNAVTETGSGNSLPVTMFALRVAQFGGPEAIYAEQIPVPEPGEHEVLVKVFAAGVGPWDAWIRSGHSVLPQPLPLTPGSDISGVVVAIGKGVHGFAVGEAVYGVTNKRFTNGYAQYAACRADMLAPKPAALSYTDAASVPVIAVTAWQMLFECAGLKSGQRVELNAFTSPQFIKWLEAKLNAHLPHRLLPADDVLRDAYRRALVVARLNKVINAARDEAVGEARGKDAPKGLRQQLEKMLRSANAKPWDRALYRLAAEAVGD